MVVNQFFAPSREKHELWSLDRHDTISDEELTELLANAEETTSKEIERVATGLKIASPEEAAVVDDAEDSPADSEEFTKDHEMFLRAVYDALTDGLNSYHIKDSMKELPYSETAADLREWGYLEKFTLGNRQAYYWPTDEANVVVDRNLAPRDGGEYGRESPEHRVGVKLIQAHYDALGYETHMYYSPEDEEKKYDLYAKPTDDSPDDRIKIVEVETSPNKRRHVEDDYIKLANMPGDGIWVVKDIDGMRQLLSSLADQIGYVEATSTTNFEKTSDKLDVPGMERIFGINKLKTELGDD